MVEQVHDHALAVRYHDGVVHVVGEIDMSTCSLLDEMLSKLDTALPVLVDLSEVAFMDSHGLRVLIVHNNRRADDHCGLTIVDPSEQVRRLLEITGLEANFHVESQ